MRYYILHILITLCFAQENLAQSQPVQKDSLISIRIELAEKLGLKKIPIQIIPRTIGDTAYYRINKVGADTLFSFMDSIVTIIKCDEGIILYAMLPYGTRPYWGTDNNNKGWFWIKFPDCNNDFGDVNGSCDFPLKKTKLILHFDSDIDFSTRLQLGYDLKENKEEIMKMLKEEFELTSSVYKNLETKKFYRVNAKVVIDKKQGVEKYTVEGKNVDEATYNKYQGNFHEFIRCCPCILKWFDINETLVCEAVACTDCMIGSYKEFYPNGKIKEKGQYKETKGISLNEEGETDWDPDTICSIKTGKWSYFSNKGDTLYHEYWKEGEFIKQVPEQKKIEIWRVDAFLSDEKIEHGALTTTIDQVKNIIFKPKYKNSIKDDNGIVILINVFDGKKTIPKKYTLESFKNIDINKVLSQEASFKSINNFQIRIYHKENEEDWVGFIVYIKN